MRVGLRCPEDRGPGKLFADLMRHDREEVGAPHRRIDDAQLQELLSVLRDFAVAPRPRVPPDPAI